MNGYIDQFQNKSFHRSLEQGNMLGNLKTFMPLAMAAIAVSQSVVAAEEGVVDWKLTRLDELGGHKTTVAGAPRVVEGPQGKAIEFNGIDEGLFLDHNPLAGLERFTAEVIFRPQAGGPMAQRFVHMQEDGSENRLLFETRLTDDNRWFLDSFIKSGDGNFTLFAEKSLHSVGPWYHAAVVVDGTTMRHYVNGKEELSTPITFKPQKPGRMSIGVRINKVSWYKGAVRQLRITPRVLTPPEFLKP